MNFTVKFSFQSICFISFFLAFPAFSQQAEEVPPSSIINDAKQVKESVALIGLTKEIIVTGDMLYDSYFIGAETIQFKSGARLIFSDKALATRNNLIIAAKNIVNEDQQKTWSYYVDTRRRPLIRPPQSGQAPGGAHGNNSGVSGSAGANGAQGNPGIAGKNAPNLTLFFITATGAPPVIDLRGQPGDWAARDRKEETEVMGMREVQPLRVYMNVAAVQAMEETGGVVAVAVWGDGEVMVAEEEQQR